MKQQLETDLISIVKQLKDGEDAGSDKQTHLASDVTCRRPQSHKEKHVLYTVYTLLFHGKGKYMILTRLQESIEVV